MMPLATLSGTEYPTFATLATANEYLAADARHAAAWTTKGEGDRARLLVSATRAMQAMRWRDDVDADPEGSPPDAFAPACILYAAEGLTNPGIFAARDTGPVVLEQEVTIPGAGGGTKKRFGYVKTALPLPNAVFRLVSPYLAGAGARIGAGSFRGGSEPARLSDDFGYTGPVG